MKYYDIYDFNGIGYEKLFHHRDWRVAVLNYIDELEIDALKYMEAHNLTDEVFVLLEGSCHLFFAEVIHDEIKSICALNLEKHKVYKIPAGIFHTHTLSHDAKLLIIEEENTSDQNSPRIYLTEQDKEMIKEAYERERNV
ncbi:MAG: hypothetical protein CVV62_00905 [Tenericutes bacterium HGW-Tenericutes-7]|nr:MAG: hypothetical protein CVV62_00905 [Tenericutes bacterium HGW-Tenericutes-7]